MAIIWRMKNKQRSSGAPKTQNIKYIYYLLCYYHKNIYHDMIKHLSAGFSLTSQHQQHILTYAEREIWKKRVIFEDTVSESNQHADQIICAAILSLGHARYPFLQHFDLPSNQAQTPCGRSPTRPRLVFHRLWCCSALGYYLVRQNF